MEQKKDDSELNLEKFFKIIKNYKYLILFLTLITTLLMFVKLYFTPSIYQASSILEVKTKSKGALPNDLLLNTLSFSGGTGKTEKEIEILQTFLVNKEALKKVNLEVSYYKTKDYRDIELYTDTPITIKNIKIYNEDFIGVKFTILPKKRGFSILLPLSIKEAEELNSDKVFAYNEEIKNKLFSFTIDKKYEFKEAIKVSLNGDNRILFEEVVKPKLKVSQMSPDTPLIKILYEDNIPQRATAYLNALMESFIEQSVNTKNEQNNKILTFINERLSSIRSELETSESKLENFKRKHKIVNSSSQATSYIKKLADLEVQISENQLKERLLQNLIIFARHNQSLDSIAPSLVELNDKPTIGLITSLQSLQLQEGELKVEYTDQFPKLINIRRQISNIRKKIILNIKNLKSSIKQKNRFLIQKKKKLEKKIQKLPVKEKQMVNIKRGYTVSSTMYNYLLKKKTESELLIVSTLSDYKIIDKAHALKNPIKPKKTLLMVASALIGLFIGILLSVILQGFNSKINSKEELENLGDYPLLGIVPELKKKSVQLEVYSEKNSPFTESYRTLRSYLPTKDERGLAKIILLTSIEANEGKTTITANLAAITQMAGSKSIILNLDLRKPNLHGYFGLRNNKGMSSYLRGEDTVQDIIFATKYTNLHVITSGPIPENPAELILSPRLPELLDVLKRRYDYIFLDSAPVGLVSDTIHLMKLSDLNLIVFREGKAEKSFVSVLQDISEKNNLKNIGFILNHSSAKNSKDTYGYGYGYGYGNY